MYELKHLSVVRYIYFGLVGLVKTAAGLYNSKGSTLKKKKK